MKVHFVVGAVIAVISMQNVFAEGYRPNYQHGGYGGVHQHGEVHQHGGNHHHSGVHQQGEVNPYGGVNQRANGTSKGLQLEYGWKFIDYDFLSANARNAATKNGEYNFTKIIPRDVDIWEKGGRRKVFITTPLNRAKQGVPATLSTISDQGDGSRSPLLAPYPDWTWHRKSIDSINSSCDNVIGTVHRITIDSQDRLWVVDDGDAPRCKRKLLAFDLNTDRLVDRYVFPDDVLLPGSSIVTPAVDVRDNGKNTFVYIADIWGFAIVVYDFQKKTSWRVSHPLFDPEEKYGKIEIEGKTLDYPDGVFGLALGPLHCADGGRLCPDQDRNLYFHSLASLRENYVKTSVLRDSANFPNGENKVPSEFKSFDALRTSQSAGQDMTSRGVLFSGLLRDLAVTCWNSNRPFPGPQLQVVARDPEALQFVSAVKVRGNRLWVLSSRAQRYATNTMNWDEVNTRVLTANIADLVRGTDCDV